MLRKLPEFEIAMTTIEAQIPEPVLQQAAELAAREDIPLAEVISRAVTQAVGAWSQESENALRAKCAGREKFLNAITAALNADSPDCSRLTTVI